MFVRPTHSSYTLYRHNRYVCYTSVDPFLIPCCTVIFDSVSFSWSNSVFI